MRAPVRLDNPAGGSGFINRKRAQRLVHKGVARWLDARTIAFIETDHQAARIHGARLSEMNYDRAASSGMATIEQLRHIPMVGQVERLLTERRRRPAA